MPGHPIPPGTRVRHFGHQRPGDEHGTATVVRAQAGDDGKPGYLVRMDPAPVPIPDMPDGPMWWPELATVPAVRASTPA